MADLPRLLREAEKPDRHLDCRIWLKVGEQLGSRDTSARNKQPLIPSMLANGRWMGSAFEKYPDDVDGVARCWNVPRFTASLDAALMLAPNNKHHELMRSAMDELSKRFHLHTSFWPADKPYLEWLARHFCTMALLASEAQ